MAQKPKEVRVRDVRQGKTFWLVDVVIPDGVPTEHRIKMMARYPHTPERWANGDAWARSRVKKPQRFFVANSRAALEELSILLEASKLFFRYSDAFEYYWMIAGVLAKETLALEARFPAFINMPKVWNSPHGVKLADVELDLSMIPRGLKINQ
jgi:hypothetical protein